MLHVSIASNAKILGSLLLLGVLKHLSLQIGVSIKTETSITFKGKEDWCSLRCIARYNEALLKVFRNIPLSGFEFLSREFLQAGVAKVFRLQVRVQLNLVVYTGPKQRHIVTVGLAEYIEEIVIAGSNCL